MKDFNMSILLDFYKGFLTEKQVEIIEFYYDQDLSLTEISDNLSITRQAVRDGLSRAEDLLKSFEDKVGAVRRYLYLTNIIEKVSLHTNVIVKMARKSGDYQIVNEADSILSHLREARDGI